MAAKKMEKTDETTQVTAQPEAQTASAAAMEAKVPQDAPAVCGDEVMESLDELALRHRLPTWQSAALLRFTGWADDKRVTEAHFLAALEELSRRPLGGGRR